LPLRITGGGDTHLDTHVAAALDHHGGLLGVEAFATTPAGYEDLLGWLKGSVRSSWLAWRAQAPTGRASPVTSTATP
jgi:hypothetical protein